MRWRQQRKCNIIIPSHTPSHNGTYRPTHLPTMGHTVPHIFPQWDTPSHSGTPLSHCDTLSHTGAQTHSNWTYLLFLLPSGLLLVQLTWLHPLPTPPPFNIIVHTVGAARQGPAGSGVRRRNTLGRVSTPSVFCWHRVHSNTTNKHTLDEGAWSVDLEVGLQSLHTCMLHTFHAPISSRYSNHKMCPLHTFHLCIQRYRGRPWRLTCLESFSVHCFEYLVSILYTSTTKVTQWRTIGACASMRHVPGRWLVSWARTPICTG